jgi:hypothetical protein
MKGFASNSRWLLDDTECVPDRNATPSAISIRHNMLATFTAAMIFSCKVFASFHAHFIPCKSKQFSHLIEEGFGISKFCSS